MQLKTKQLSSQKKTEKQPLKTANHLQLKDYNSCFGEFRRNHEALPNWLLVISTSKRGRNYGWNCSGSTYVPICLGRSVLQWAMNTRQEWSTHCICDIPDSFKTSLGTLRGTTAIRTGDPGLWSGRPEWKSKFNNNGPFYNQPPSQTQWNNVLPEVDDSNQARIYTAFLFSAQT